MEPERDEVVELLDRILEKGVVVNADLIITLAEVPLIGVDLRVALAGIDKMLDYGLFEDWDAAHKAIDEENESGGARSDVNQTGDKS
ncbi:gas vesicle protein [Candidatus Bipolaricaulota bacterium]|nr:gas vesicle protein [Candidatus Bipolaricaulota bacterium]